MSDPETWTTSQVTRWLASLSLSEYSSGFESSHIDGHMLSAATEEDLAEIGIATRLHRFKIVDSFQREIATFRSSHQGFQPPPPMQWGPPGPPPPGEGPWGHGHGHWHHKPGPPPHWDHKPGPPPPHWGHKPGPHWHHKPGW